MNACITNAIVKDTLVKELWQSKNNASCWHHGMCSLYEAVKVSTNSSCAAGNKLEKVNPHPATLQRVWWGRIFWMNLNSSVSYRIDTNSTGTRIHTRNCYQAGGTNSPSIVVSYSSKIMLGDVLTVCSAQFPCHGMHTIHTPARC
jgi:hypothetical protein